MKRLNIQRDICGVWFWVLFLAGLSGVLLFWSMLQPFGAPPDEMERFKIVSYLVNHGRLPHGGDPEIMLDGWGFSYGFQPILPYIVDAFFLKAFGLFSDSVYLSFVAARFGSVLTGVIMAAVVWRLSLRLFSGKLAAALFVLLVCLWPQAMFMHTYVNVDSMALMSSAVIVYAWVRGLETKWDGKTCLLLGVGCGLCAMSYYNAYGFLLCSLLLFVGSHLLREQREALGGKAAAGRLFGRGLIVFAVAFAIAGWWFIRNALLYDGDFLGLATREAYAERYAADHLKPSQAPTWHNAGFSILEMLSISDYLPLMAKSFVGMFEHMKLPLPEWMYPVYWGLLGLGLAAAVLLRIPRAQGIGGCRGERAWFHASMAACIVIPNLLCLWSAYDTDYQPQGRYVLPMLVPLMYYTARGYEKLAFFLGKRLGARAGRIVLAAVCLAVIVLAFLAFKDIIFTKYYYNFSLVRDNGFQ